MRAILVFVLCLVQPALADQPALCEVTRGGDSIDGPCQFTLRKGGSFDIRMRDGQPFGAAPSLSLDITAKGRGTVRAGDDWGPVSRSADDPACWNGDGFALCVRAADEGTVFAGRCHMDACTWVDQSPAREIAPGSAAIAGRQVAVTQRFAMTEHPGGAYPAAPPADAVWSPPATARFFCSMARPAFQDADGAWIVLPLPDVFGVTESVTQMYLRACHPGAPSDPYAAAAALGYAAGQPDVAEYPTFEALIRP